MATRKEIEYLQEYFDYEGLKTIGFFKNIKREDFDGQISRICEWFGIVNIFQYEKVDMQEQKYFVADFRTFSEN
ncbi:hypothetical protein BN1195_03620 [Chryseobacterium oranimense G311]|uniref:hypothetical protein n=1 Tax=Chryseobacterium oranimense TaxID=421058 RepID=UPI0005339A29|nr:hypothetical protein [Chryseobacterium oranimense]CEJ71275.1 hypothetical protein BN1195_03620 [Chryseobacterium oranimense G311]DAG72861.1 MAG TPA: hypothetical protein [Caudoviricetes sp.]